MAVALPTSFSTELVEKRTRPLLVFEIAESGGTTLRYTSRANVTWNGDSYTRLAIRSTPIIERMGERVPEVTLTLSNVENDLRGFIEPTDKITGRRITIRLLLFDRTTGVAFADSVVQFVGIIERPRKVNQTTFEIRAVGLIQGSGPGIPARRYASWCNFRYGTGAADGFGCTHTADGSCFHEWVDCNDSKANGYQFGGFRGMDASERDALRVRYGDGAWRTRPRVATAAEPPETIVDPQEPISLVYGSREVSGKLIEGTAKSWAVSQTEPFLAHFYGLSEGEISGVNGFREGDGGDLILAADEVYTQAGRKWFGMFYRAGTQSTDDDETEADYAADSTTRLRPQNRDWISGYEATYQHLAYGILLQPSSEDFDELSDVRWAVEGILCQKYTNDTSPTTDGVPAFSRNPIWQAVDLATNARYGGGRVLTVNDLYFPTDKTEADYCDVLIDGPATTVTTGGGPTVGIRAEWGDDVYRVGDASEFTRGMIVIYDGAPYSNETDEVVDVINSRTLRLGTVRVNKTWGHTITAKVPRYQSDIEITSATDLNRQIHLLLSSCMGYLSYNAGKIEFRADRPAGSSTGHYKDTGYSAGFGIIKDSFEWLTDADSANRAVNRVYVRYVNEEGTLSEEVATDWDHLDTNDLVEHFIDAPGIKTRDIAARVARVRLKQFRQRNPGCRFKAGPIALKHQIGDVIEVTHTVPNWTGEFMRVIGIRRYGLGDRDDTLVELECEAYDATVYDDLARPPTRAEPLVWGGGLTLIAAADSLGRVVLTWTIDEDAPRAFQFYVYKDSLTFTQDVPPTTKRIGRVTGTRGRRRRSYTYTPTDAELNSTLYFKVVGFSPRYGAVWSNTLSVVPADLDPTSTGNQAGMNMVFDGDFRSADPFAPLAGFIGAWRVSVPTIVRVPPTNSTATGDVGFNSPALAYDDDEGTNATGLGTNSTTVGEKWSGFGAGSATGYLEALMSAQGKGSAKLDYSNDGESAWLTLGSPFVSPTYWRSPTFTADKSDLRVRATLSGNIAGNKSGTMTEINFQAISDSGLLATISGSVGGVRGFGGAYAELFRPFPGGDPVPGSLVFVTSGTATVQIMARADSTPDEDLEILIRDPDSGLTWPLLTVPKADVTSAWQGFAGLFTAASDVIGELEIVVRTKSTVMIQVDKLMITRGEGVYAFETNPEETGYRGDQKTGRLGLYDRGAWAGQIRKAALL